ncbi:DUF2125 domain-containing protein [Paracoccus sp. (in: a-proteobacteria)]|uniref:DUF2125 domain-containing protein n=1 Tax=Paracoccus sp. TaxID=267 RepID=UPI0026DF879D|nr:DUF2125 domain-containing protein [Paracoccus sp. (in: a-proteobacteria)]MDO5646569.1 DUF2125 domain-containing protein [Paracoccus sp. (in: a-proteobacteria)]
MRKGVAILIVLFLLLAGAWLWAESRAAGALRDLAADHAGLSLSDAQPLRNPARLGVRVTDAAMVDRGQGIGADWAELWLSPASPLTARLQLSDNAWVYTGSEVLNLRLRDAHGALSLSPLNRMALSHLAVHSGPVTVNDAPFLASLDATLDLTSLRHDAPRLAGAAYLATVQVGQVQPLGQIEPISADGTLRLWLDRAIHPGDNDAPILHGVQTDGVTVSLGDMTARILGRVERQPDNMAQGQIAAYSSDSAALIDYLAQIGVLPDQARLLARVAVTRFSDAPDMGAVLPEPQGDETRLVITMRNGQVLLGNVPIGPAPRFPD